MAYLGPILTYSTHDPRPDKGLEGPRRGSEEVSLTTISVKNR
jgi:hypothetical protein